MDLTKAQITKRAWNIKNKEYKREWDKKNRPWKWRTPKYKLYLEKRRIERGPRYNPITAKKNREKHKKNKTQKWFSDSLRKIIYDIFRRRSSLEFKMLNSQELLGTDFETARKHIESLFQPGMSWNNRSEWHIDHIIPCSSFDLKCPVQQRACCHYTNLQPLWAFDNMSKGKKIISRDITS